MLPGPKRPATTRRVRVRQAMVRIVRLELTRLAALPPQDSVSTNSTISAEKHRKPASRQLKKMAERTGLEPATPGVTGRYSNQLNYRSKTNSKTKGLDASDLALHGRLPPAHALAGVPKGIRTPVTAVKGRCPRPLDDGDLNRGGHSTCPGKKLQSVSYPGRSLSWWR